MIWEHASAAETPPQQYHPVRVNTDGNLQSNRIATRERKEEGWRRREHGRGRKP